MQKDMGRVPISIHAPLAGCDGKAYPGEEVPTISIHAPLAGCDRLRTFPVGTQKHFNPRTPCGVRQSVGKSNACYGHFNPRTPCGVRRPPRRSRTSFARFQSTHPLRGATRAIQRCPTLTPISIHAPLAGCDDVGRNDESQHPISIHAPLAGCDSSKARSASSKLNFNPRTPCGVRLQKRSSPRQPARFQSTHPLRGATKQEPPEPKPFYISIHAPLAGCDRPSEAALRAAAYFNPRTPCGVRPSGALSLSHLSSEFQSTHPLRGATVFDGGRSREGNISIHAPLAGCDRRSGGD